MKKKKSLRAAKKISKLDAYRMAKKVGCDFSRDFHAQRMDCSSELVRLSKLAGYRKPANASGSTARYFFDHLDRLRMKRGWK